jgi:hypothetical protein
MEQQSPTVMQMLMFGSVSSGGIVWGLLFHDKRWLQTIVLLVETAVVPLETALNTSVSTEDCSACQFHHGRQLQTLVSLWWLALSLIMEEQFPAVIQVFRAVTSSENIQSCLH